MKKRKKLLLSIIGIALLIGVLFSGCELFGFGSIWTVSPTFPFIEGEITVAEASYWTYVKVGVFTDTAALESRAGWVSSSTYRLVYEDLADGTTAAAVTPDNLGSEMVAGDSALKKFYYLELPPTPTNSYAVAWYDTDSDGKLDFIDINASSLIGGGDDDATVADQLDGSGYKYNDSIAGPEVESDSNEDFNFTISTNTGY